ncbi:hypothetical protein PENTCL1PPCAC_20822, partial [Pristionchus entomophagus]
WEVSSSIEKVSFPHVKTTNRDLWIPVEIRYTISRAGTNNLKWKIVVLLTSIMGLIVIRVLFAGWRNRGSETKDQRPEIKDELPKTKTIIA